MEEVVPQPANTARKRIFFSKLRRKLLKHVWLVRIAILAAFAVGVFGLVIIFNFLFGKTTIGLYFKLARNFVSTPQSEIANNDGKTNILILGKGGEGHEAPDLTDTIIFLTINHTPAKITLISIPRDIWVPEIRAKLNSSYYWGNVRQEGGGIILAKSNVEKIVGEPIHYAAVFDFTAFKKVIDILEGVEVEVDQSFIDEKFPIPGKENDECSGDPEYKCRYETIRFEKGIQVMDGETALKFVRSRNAKGDQGTDIAREARQQKVISAIKKKLLDKKTVFSPKKLLALVDVAKQYVETDIPVSSGAVIARRLLQAKDYVSSFVLPEELIINPSISPKYDNQYVFIPRATDWSEVNDWVQCVITSGDCD